MTRFIGIFLLIHYSLVLYALPQKGIKAQESFRAYDFIQSIGINTHFGYYDTQYRHYEKVLKKRLLELGVKHIRDGTYNNDVLQKYKDIGENGVRLLLITPHDKAVERAKAIGSMLWGVEAVNEPDGGKQPGTWEKEARLEQQQLYESIKNDAETQNIAVVGVSLANIRDNPRRLGDISQWMDYGGMHPYAAGQYPAFHWGWGMSMDNAVSEARNVSGNKPLIVTECGYHNKEHNPNHPGVPEAVAAIYHLHLFFVYFNKGIQRSYKYELLDLKPDKAMTDMECHFGLVRSDGTVKPSFTALKNLIRLLNDSDQEFSPHSLPLQITTAGNVAIQSTLLQKSDGSWWLALFRPVSVYDLKNKKRLTVPPVSVTVELEKNKNTYLYNPIISDKPVMSFKKKREITFELGEEVLLLEIKK